ncbi:MAG TPA: urate hydroxylase PuuD [Acetobacteraceae bacterium]|nr:urate hydroxylase PuuD [Acetobacteraceae bacterium]
MERVNWMGLSLLLDWAELVVRWTHVVAAIAWIGASFYFVALDAGLKPQARLGPGVRGEAWQVHGGGFYQMRKYLVAPEFMPPDLTWFKWEAYSTWIFGFLLLLLVYYLHPGLYLIDPAVARLSGVEADAIGLGSLVLGWLVYNRLCRSRLGAKTLHLAVAGFGLLIVAAFGYTHVFGGRGAFLHVGALVGTIMAANVAMVIIPNQRRVVADLIAGKTPDPALGAEAKQRSLHNNYLTLPVVFTMISNHYAFTFQGRWNWLLLIAVFISGFLIRHWFNVRHSGARPDWRLWPAAALPVLACVALTIRQQAPAPATAPPARFAAVEQVIATRCHTCHAAHPSFEGFSGPPKGIMFDTPAEIVSLAPSIYQQAVTTRAMPLGNLTGITEDERQVIAAWFDHGAGEE